MPVSIFDLSATGAGTVGSEYWIDLGLIPTGKQIWIGYASYTSIDKVVKFELRGNLATKSAGVLGDTSLLASASVKTGCTVNQDLYRKGRLLLRTVVGTGVEHWWLHLVAKGAAGSYLYTISYTEY